MRVFHQRNSILFIRDEDYTTEFLLGRVVLGRQLTGRGKKEKVFGVLGLDERLYASWGDLDIQVTIIG